MGDLKSLQRNSLSNDHAERVRLMFEGIANRYDLLNHLLSGNTDKRWRRLVAKSLKDELAKEDARVLDVACGTGDLAIVLAETGQAKVTGLDFCRPMLEIADQKRRASNKHISLIEGDALSLPFPDSTFNIVSIAFGLRNLSNVEAGLRELLRVLKPNGQVAILEFSKPIIPGFRELFQLYFTHVLPRIGGLISRSRGAYEYLPNSVSHFMDQEQLSNVMRLVGFKDIEYKNLTGGIAALHIGRRSHN
jgi:demethylmenaquinone methyltransferase / 2-methoxy-6-polyprenyl-1,4-benzoquinol methylase